MQIALTMQLENQTKQSYIQIGANILAYKTFGSGKQILIAIHGYGQSKAHWSFLKDFWPDTTIIAIDLPHHKDSVWNDAKFTLIHLQEMLLRLKEQLGFQEYSLIGFSMGARICLNILLLDPNHIKNIILIAPDGLVHNFWYNLATRKSIGKRIFRYVTLHPNILLRSFDYLHKIKTLKESNYKYFKDQFGNKRLRLQLYKTWNVLSELKNDPKNTIKVLNNSPISIQVLAGLYDHIIPVKHAYHFKAKVPKTQLNILNKGHRMLNKSILPYLNTTL